MKIDYSKLAFVRYMTWSKFLKLSLESKLEFLKLFFMLSILFVKNKFSKKEPVFNNYELILIEKTKEDLKKFPLLDMRDPRRNPWNKDYLYGSIHLLGQIEVKKVK